MADDATQDLQDRFARRDELRQGVVDRLAADAPASDRDALSEAILSARWPDDPTDTDGLPSRAIACLIANAVLASGFRRRRVITDPAEIRALSDSAPAGMVIRATTDEWRPYVLERDSSGRDWYRDGFAERDLGWLMTGKGLRVTVLYDPSTEGEK